MEKAFKEMVFEWEYIHPKSSATNDSELSPTLLIPAADSELEEEDKEEEIFQKEDIFSKENMDEVVAVENETDSQVMVKEEEEDETDWGLQSLLFKEAEDDNEIVVQFEDQKIKENFDFDAFRLKTWLRSAVMAAATISIFVMGRGRVRVMGKRKNNIQSAVLQTEKVREVSVQHQQTALPSFSFIGHYGEMF